MDAGGDLHAGFRSPELGRDTALIEFLGAVDRLPGVRVIRRAMRAAIALGPGMTLIDAGCGIGLETHRLATWHPAAKVQGLDHNEELLRYAREHGPLPNLIWRAEDLNAPAGPDGIADVVRTERVLMYQDDLDTALDGLLRLLRPGGRLVCFELDYGAVLLDRTSVDDAELAHLEEVMRASLPQPYAGRVLPARLAARGLTVTAEPYCFSVTRPVWTQIVGNTLRAHDATHPAVRKWLEHHNNTEAPMPAAFTGVLTVATQP